MSHKKKKQQRELEKLIEGFMMLCIFAAFFGVFSMTKSFVAAGIAAGFVTALFIAVRLYRNMIHEEKLKKSGIKDIDEMNGRQFEHYLGHLFKAHGYAVEVTRAASDYGADLVITKDERRSLFKQSVIVKR